MRRISPLLALEFLALAVWIGLAAIYVTGRSSDEGIQPLDPEALISGPSDAEWMGVYFQGTKVGYATNSRTPLEDGGLLVQHRSAFQMAAFGVIKEVVVVGSAYLDPEGLLRQFDFFTSSDPVRLAARGKVEEDELVVEIHQAGEVQTIRLPIEEPPQISVSLGVWVASQESIVEGQVFEFPYFDPVTLAQSTMTIRVVGTELLPNGEEAFWLERSFAGATSRTLMTPAGDTLREEGALGIALVRETAEEAMRVPSQDNPVDIIALSAVPLTGHLLQPRKSVALNLQVLGVEPETLFHQPPQQVVEDDRVVVTMPTWEDLPALPRVEVDPAFAEYLEATPFLPVQHREIQELAAELVEGIGDRKLASKVIGDHVFERLDKVPTMGVPNALEVLRVGQGDCNEHTSLYVALARAAGIPARIVAGVVYSSRLTSQGAFYYHAWPEIYLGEAGWVPVDPTFGQRIADATHVKIVEGDLARQIEIMGVMGRLSFALVEVR